MEKTTGKSGPILAASGILLLFVLAHFGHHLVSAMLSPLMPYIRDDFKLSFTEIGLLQSSFSLAYGFSQIPLGWLSDRVGRRILITLGISGMALFAFLIGFAPNFYFVAACLVMMGIMGGGYHPASAPLVSATVAPGQRGKALGIHQIGGTGSQLIAPLLATAIAVLWGWRNSYITLGIGTFLLGLLLFVWLRGNGQGGKPAPKAKSEVRPREKLSAVFWRRMIAFLVMSTVIQGFTGSVSALSTLFLVDHFGQSKEVAGMMYALIQVGGLIAGPLGGYLSDRVGSLRIFLILSVVAAPVIYLFTVVPFSYVTVGILLALVGFCQWGRMPVSEAYIMNETSEQGRSTVLGIYYAAGRTFPGLISPVVGNITDRYGLAASFTAIAATVGVLTAIGTLFLWEHHHNPPSESQAML
jgi:predicted MFS family arabinose efflux permease